MTQFWSREDETLPLDVSQAPRVFIHSFCLRRSIFQINSRIGTPNRSMMYRPGLRGKHSAWAAMVVVAVLIVFGAIAASVRLSSKTRESLQSTGSNLVPSVFRQPLFNGESVPIGTQRGNWQVTKAKDGGRVLSGKNGWLDLMLPPPPSTNAQEYFELRLGINPLEAAEAELQFGHGASESGMDHSRYVITLAKGLAQVGRRSDIDAPFQPLAGVASLLAPNASR